MSNCMPNLNYMRKRVLRMRGAFVNVMLLLHMKSKPTEAVSHIQKKESIKRNLHRPVLTLEMHHAALSHLWAQWHSSEWKRTEPDEFFWNENGEGLWASTILAASVLARLMRDRVENMSGEMKLTLGAHSASPAQLPRLSLLLQHGGRKSAGGRITSAIISLFISSLRRDSLFPRTPCPEYNVTTSCLCAPVHCSPSTPMHCQKFLFFFFSTFICSASSPASSSSLSCLLSSSGANHGCIGTSPFIMPMPVRSEESVQAGKSVCWGVKDPLSPEPSPAHPVESPDGVIQSSWSSANS